MLETRVDPITLEVLRHAFIGVADEMKLNLMRTAYNPIIYEVLDFSCGVFDRECRMIAQADGLPIFLGNLAAAVRVCVDDIGAENFRPGDIYLFNDPYEQGNHLNDLTTIQPVFDDDGELQAFASTRAHSLDIGGKDPGGSIDSTDIVQEGLWFRSVQLYAEGKLNESVWRIIEYNVRYTKNMLGDLRAQVAASRTGEARMQEVLRKHGSETVNAAIDEIVRQGEQRARAAVAAMPDGVYEAESCLDDDCLGTGPLPVKVKAIVEGDRLILDLEGTAPQNPGPVNCGLPATLAACRIAFKALTNPGVPASEGDFVPLELRCPEGTMCSAVYPAPTFMYGTHLLVLTDVVVKALAQAIPDKVIAGHYGNLSGFMIVGNDPRTGGLYIQQEPEVGGWGASAETDGESAMIFVGDGDTRNIQAEVLETRFPLRLERHELRRDSGGPGRRRGGLGIYREYRVVGHEAFMTCIMDRKICPPWGLFGGKPAQHDRVVIGDTVHQKGMRVPISAGTLISVQTGGGGGWGEPREREPERVRADVVAGYISRESAERDYGVVVSETSEIVEVAAVSATAETRIDPITLEVLRHAFVAVADEMKITLQRTAYNPIIYDVLDFSCGVFDPDCRMIAQADGLPIFLGNLAAAIRACVDDVGAENFREGDLYLFNDPYAQGNHLNDVTTIQPVFDDDGELAAFVSTRAHWLDIGGNDPGGSLDATDIVQEGLWLRSVQLYDEGRLNESVWRIIEYNVRYTKNMLGDLRAQVAASRTGEERFRSVLRRYGRGAVQAVVDQLIRQGEQRARAAVAAMPDGVYTADACLDDDCLGNGPLPIHLTATIAGDELTIDLTGSHEMNPGPVNCGLPATLAACRIALKALTNPNAPANEGDFAPLRLVVPEASMFDARYPAPMFVSVANLIILTDVVVRALAPAVPERAVAGHYGSLCGFMIVGDDPRTGRLYIQQEPEVGGWGASAEQDGESALIFVADGDTRNLPAEVLESRFPLRLERYELRQDSGGAGRNRGGLGVIRDYRIVAHDAHMTCIMDRKTCPPWGLDGGGAAEHDRVVLRGESYYKGMRVPVGAGELVSVRTGGGGGFGDPLAREPERVRADVVGGYVSRERAERDYGVVLDPLTFDVVELRR